MREFASPIIGKFYLKDVLDRMMGNTSSSLDSSPYFSKEEEEAALAFLKSENLLERIHRDLDDLLILE